MKRAIQLGFLLLCAVCAFGQCGWKNDTSIHVPANYPTPFTAPGINGTYTDATGCSPKQITASSQHGGVGVSVEYNLVNAISADDLYVMGIVRGSGSFEIYRISNSQVVVPLGNVPGNIQSTRWAGAIGTGSLGGSSNPLTDGHTVYALVDNGTDTVLAAYTFTDTGCAPSCTMTKHTLHTFTGYTGNGTATGFGAQEFSGGEADISDDGNHTVLDDDSGTAPSVTHKILTTYTISTDTVVRAWDYTSVAGPLYLNGAVMAHNNSVLVNWNNQGTCSPLNVDCFDGAEVYDNGLNYQTQLVFTGLHRASAWDGTNNYLIAYDNNTSFCSPSNLNGLIKIDIVTRAHTCLMTFGGTTQAGGPSCRNGLCSGYIQDMRGLGGNVPNGTEITSVNNASAGSTVYNSIPQGFLGMGIIGLEVDIPATGYSGSFSNASNNGRFLVTAQSGGGATATMNNPSGVAETANVSFQGEATNTYPLLPAWASEWRAYDNEIILYNLATNDNYRLVQTRTCPAAQVDYWKEAFPPISLDGTMLAYMTDFCQNSLVGFTNLMVLPFLTSGNTSLQGVTLRGVSVQ